MAFLSGLLGILSDEGVRVDRPGTPALVVLGSGLTATLTTSASGIDKVTLAVSGGAEGDFGFDADGRLQVSSTGDTVTACDQSVPVFGDLLVVFRFEYPGDDVAYGSDPTASPAFIVTPPWPVDLKSLEMHILPKLPLTADNTDYARIDLQQGLFADNLFCRCETRSSGGTHPTGDWDPGTVTTPTMEAYSPAYLEAGSPLVLIYNKYNAGVILPPHTVEIRAKRAGVH